MYDGKKLKEVRKHLDITQVQAAELLEISQPYYSALEKGTRDLNGKLVAHIIKVFNIDKEFFKIGNDENFISLKMASKEREQNWAIEAGIAYDLSNAPKDKSIKYNGGYDENEIDYYYQHSEYRLDKLLSAKIGELKSAYEANNQLVSTIIFISNNQQSVIEKFTVCEDFRIYKNKLDKELKEFNFHIEDEKLYKAIRLNNYSQMVAHWYNVIRININRMDGIKITLKLKPQR